MPKKPENRVIAGIDEAGRGAVIGPLVIAGVSVSGEREAEFRRMGVRDSKLIAPGRRKKLALAIERMAEKNDCFIAVSKIGACKIDSYDKAGINLNELEAMKMADIIPFMNAARVYVDSPEQNTGKLAKKLVKLSKTEAELIVEHKADQNYPVCSAASIIAKVTRDEEIAKLHKKYGNFGSGYPSDSRTTDFLKNYLKRHNRLPECVREKWETTKKIRSDHKQFRLGKWFRK